MFFRGKVKWPEGQWYPASGLEQKVCVRPYGQSRGMLVLKSPGLEEELG